MKWACLHSHSHYSLSDAIAKPEKMAARCADRGMPAAAITDHGNLGCAVDFTRAMKGVGVRPIMGCEFNLCSGDATVKTAENRDPYAHTVILAKNLAGWRKLMGAVSRSASKDYAFHGPRLNLEDFRDFAGDLMAVTGHIGSDMANALFSLPRSAYAGLDRGEIHGQCVDRQGWGRKTTSLIEQYVSIFGAENVFLEAQAMAGLPASEMAADAMRYISKKTGRPCVATADVHYVDAQDGPDQRVVLCAGMRTSFQRYRKRITQERDYTIDGFFLNGDCHHLPTVEELGRLHSGQEIEDTLRVAEMCEDYDILNQPQLPRFACPDGMTPEAYLRELCERGWKEKVEGRSLAEPEQVYRDRLEMELGVINGAGLPSYFLICQDFMNYGRSRGWICGPARGSSAGCIVSWLTGITTIDPIRYGLLFERFFNVGRCTPGRVSLPDIDSDVPKYKREEVYRYLLGKYGEDRVAKIATFASMQGRSALTAVMSAHDVNFDLIKRITKTLPDKASISEELEEMRQRGEEPSIIGYSLDVFRDELAEWVQEQPDGTLTGEYAPLFKQARRLEGVKTHISTHAAGIVIGCEPLASVCPLKYDAREEANIACMEYPSLEAMGLCKIDLLVTVFLDKAQGVRSLLRTGRIEDDTTVGEDACPGR